MIKFIILVFRGPSAKVDSDLVCSLSVDSVWNRKFCFSKDHHHLY